MSSQQQRLHKLLRESLRQVLTTESELCCKHTRAYTPRLRKSLCPLPLLPRASVFTPPPFRKKFRFDSIPFLKLYHALFHSHTCYTHDFHSLGVYIQKCYRFLKNVTNCYKISIHFFKMSTHCYKMSTHYRMSTHYYKMSTHCYKICIFFHTHSNQR